MNDVTYERLRERYHSEGWLPTADFEAYIEEQARRFELAQKRRGRKKP